MGLPSYVTHYYFEEPFRTISGLSQDALKDVLLKVQRSRKVPNRLTSASYLERRARYEARMYAQFCAKGGQPEIAYPYYFVLGEADVADILGPHSISLPLGNIPSEWLSFTYTDSWPAYEATTLRGDPPRKPQYEQVYRKEELPHLIEIYGWPGDRYTYGTGQRFDVSVEAQLWSTKPILAYIENH